MAEKKSNGFNYFVLFMLGVLIGVSSFTLWQYTELQKETKAQRQDITTIIQAYNNLITELQGQGIGQQK